MSSFSAGDLVILGFEGKSLSPTTVSNITREKISNFILFAHNFDSKEQLIALTDQIQSLNQDQALPFIISADQEGGRVQRFRPTFTLLPNAKRVGELKSPQIAYELTRIQARELYSAGIQLNFAPVCDINTNPANPVIGDRAYGDTEEVVSKMSSAVVRGHIIENVEPCIKHFPGHGDTHLDSHFALPTVTTPLETLRAREWIPFHRAMKSGCNFVMSAHVMLPHLDADRPGTLSPTFLKTYLREELMYQGVVTSDDMEMHAITKNYGADEAPILALKAGCDLLCYRSEDAALTAVESIKKAIQDGKLDVNELEKSVNRVKKVRSKLKLASTELSTRERAALIGNPEHLQFLQKHFP